MAGSIWFNQKLSRPAARLCVQLLCGPLLCAPLLSCVGEIVNGSYIDPLTNEGGVDPGDGAPIDTSPLADGAVRPGQPQTGRDAGPGNVSGPSEAGVTTQAPPDAATHDGGGTQTPPTAVPDASAPDAGTGTTNPKQIPVFVVVGYSGVRLASRDLGKTWVNIVTSGGSGDDQNLLRAAAYGNGLFVAAGWRIWTSPDAINWTERTNPSKQWEGGLKFGNGLFVGAGGSGSSIYSSDGITWKAGVNRNSEAGRSVAFGNGMFLTGTDAKNWWSTTDGNNWSVMSGGHATNQVMWCTNKFAEPASCTDPLARNSGQTAFGEGVWVSAGSGYIERSEDGKTWTKTQDTSANPVEGVAFGYVDN